MTGPYRTNYKGGRRRYQSGGARRPQRYVRLSASFATSMIQVSKARRRNAALATDSVTVGGERARLDFGGSLRRKAAGPESKPEAQRSRMSSVTASKAQRSRMSSVTASKARSYIRSSLQLAGERVSSCTGSPP